MAKVTYICIDDPTFTFETNFHAFSIAEMQNRIWNKVPPSMDFERDSMIRVWGTVSGELFLLETQSDFDIFRDILFESESQAGVVKFQFFTLPSMEPETTPSFVVNSSQLAQNQLPDDHPLSTLWKRYWNQPNVVAQIDSVDLSFRLESHKIHTLDIENLPFLGEGMATKGRMLVRPKTLDIQSRIEKAYAERESSWHQPGGVVLVAQTRPSLQLLYSTLESLKQGRPTVLYYRHVGFFFCPQGVFAASEDMLRDLNNIDQFSEPPFSAGPTAIMAFIDHESDPAIPPPEVFLHHPFFPVYSVVRREEGYRYFFSFGAKVIKVEPWTSREFEIM
ncbi:hypothetical protein C8J56DRAFT_935850 [Mycena floridula]|nr:hypothetical protein C8J56DRAFT_935850 [Mycena floridula]